MVVTPPDQGSASHAALIDFSGCSLTNAAFNAIRSDDYGEVQKILVHPTEGIGLSKALVRQHFSGRERWDYFMDDHTFEEDLE